MKWVEFLHSYKFVLEHRSRRSNMVVDALNRRTTLLTTMTVEMVVLEEMNKLYESDVDFIEAWKDNKKSWSGD
jgi:hypothetical protein